MTALLWTLALELPVLLIAGWRWRVVWWRVLASGLLSSGLSHPLAWHAALQMDSETYRWGWYAIEFVVVLFEAVVLAGVMRLPGLRALMLSTVANGFSAIVGRFL